MITVAITIVEHQDGMVEMKATSPPGEHATLNEIRTAKQVMGALREKMDALLKASGEGLAIEKSTVPCPHCGQAVHLPRAVRAGVLVHVCPNCGKEFGA